MDGREHSRINPKLTQQRLTKSEQYPGPNYAVDGVLVVH